MKIRTTQRISAGVSAGAIVLIAATLFLAAHHMHGLIDRNRMAGEVAKEIAELRFLTFEYLLHHDERSRTQWQLKHSALTQLLAGEGLRDEEDPGRLDKIRLHLESITRLFSQLISNSQGREVGGKEKALFQEVEARLGSQLMIKTQAIVAAAFDIRARRSARLVEAQRNATLLVMVFITIIGAIVAATSLLIERTILKPIAQFQRGTEIIAQGNLDYRIGRTSDDEIGSLSRAFDEMTLTLRTSYATLKEEIAERTNAQAELSRAHDELEDRVRERTEELQQANEALQIEIAERMRAAEAHARLVAILEATPDFVGFADAKDTRILYINRAGRKMTGIGEDEDVTQLKIADVHPDWANRLFLEEIIPTAIRDGAWTGECAFLNRHGREIPVLMVLLAHKAPGGEIEAFSTISRDITERKLVEKNIKTLNEDLVRRAAELDAINKELEAFSYSVSHDLRAPLRHVVGFAELLQKHASSVLDDKSRHYLRTISEEATRMGVLIDDLLTFSRVGRFEMQTTAVSLDQVVKEARHELRNEVAGRKIAWSVAPLPEVHGDRSLLRLVLVNLLSNALKFTRTRAQADIEIGCIPGDHENVVLFVRDNGVGFDMQYTEKLFEVFQRLHSTAEYEGTGIGLANVRRIIQRHGGRTWAEGRVEGGATFYVSLPQAKRG